MVRVLLDQFKKGYYKGQRADGFAIDAGLNRAINFIKYAAHKYSMLGVVVICGDPGTGKCQPAGSKVLMANGEWKNIENIKIGDEVVSPQLDGTNIFSKVKNLSSWYCEENYDVIEMNKNHKKLYSCSNNHLIPMNHCSHPRVKNSNKRIRKWQIKNYEASYLYKLKNPWQGRGSFSSFKINNFKNKGNCLIEPYSLGAFLGDGSFSSRKIEHKSNPVTFCNGHYRNMKSGKRIWQSGRNLNNSWRKNKFNGYISKQLAITSADPEILEEISKFYPVQNIQSSKSKAKSYRFSVVGEFAKLLEKYNLQGKGSGEKFIPQEALTSDSEYRIRLLAGLMDTDGYYNKKSNYSLTTKSQIMAKDILSLVYSLGGMGNITKIKKGVKKINFIGEYYRISFYLHNLELPLQVKRKKRDKNLRYSYLSSNRVTIKLEKSEPSQVYGFELDSPSSLYITDNWMVTHNSTLFTQLAKIVDPECNLSNTHFSVVDFCEAVGKSEKVDKVQVQADDEATDLMSRSALESGNKKVLITLARMRSKKIVVFLMLPSFFDLDRTIAMFYTKMVVRCFNRGQLKQGFFDAWLGNKAVRELYLNGKKTYSYYKPRPNLKGRFADCFCLDPEKYNDKKDAALLKMSAKENYATNRYKKQRDLLIKYVYDLGTLTQKQIGDVIGGLDNTEVGRIISRMPEIVVK